MDKENEEILVYINWLCFNIENKEIYLRVNDTITEAVSKILKSLRPIVSFHVITNNIYILDSEPSVIKTFNKLYLVKTEQDDEFCLDENDKNGNECRLVDYGIGTGAKLVLESCPLCGGGYVSTIDITNLELTTKQIVVGEMRRIGFKVIHVIPEEESFDTPLYFENEKGRVVFAYMAYADNCFDQNNMYRDQMKGVFRSLLNYNQNASRFIVLSHYPYPFTKVYRCSWMYYADRFVNMIKELFKKMIQNKI